MGQNVTELGCSAAPGSLGGRFLSSLHSCRAVKVFRQGTKGGPGVGRAEPRAGAFKGFHLFPGEQCLLKLRAQRSRGYQLRLFPTSGKKKSNPRAVKFLNLGSFCLKTAPWGCPVAQRAPRCVNKGARFLAAEGTPANLPSSFGLIPRKKSPYCSAAEVTHAVTEVRINGRGCSAPLVVGSSCRAASRGFNPSRCPGSEPAFSFQKG